MATYAQQLQDVVRQYQADHGGGTFQAKDVAAWAILKGLWKEHPSAIVNRCAEDVSRAMREEYTVDAKGRRVRIKHAISVTVLSAVAPFWPSRTMGGKSLRRLA